MKSIYNLKSWLLVALVAVFVSACATTQDEMPTDGDGAPIYDESQSGSSTGTVDSGSSGADASGLDGADGSDGTAIVDGPPMNAAEMLEETEGALASRTIYFELDSAKLTTESLAILEIHGNFVAGNGEVSIRLEGHADERGSREYNIALGDRRAQSVRRVLLFQGASSDQVETVSYGEEQPAVSGHDEGAWSKNRRVELMYTVN
ncbi:peptidoglycan-associated lipoprotein Pal [Gammaproteobacteria bacterium]|nr:peptidoglycan-associated lipoprotein Pal [Gammaproteobacteria bacterium]